MPLAQTIIPDWVFTSDPSGQVRPQASARLQRASKPQVIQTATVAEDAVIPIVYGGPERIAGMPYTVCLASNGLDLLMSFILCEGEIERVASIEVNNNALPAGVTFAAYAGTQAQGIDPDLAAAIPGYNESHPGTAYLVGRFPPGSVQGVPNVTAEVYGRKIVDRSQKGVTLLAPATQYITLANSAQNNANAATAFDISFVGALVNWGASGNPQVLVSRATAAAPVLSMQLNAAGLLRFLVSISGTGYDWIFDSPVALVPLSPGQFGGVRVVANLAANGNRTAAFYYSTDGVVWIALGATVIASNNLLPDINGAPWANSNSTSVADGTLAGMPALAITDASAAAVGLRTSGFVAVPNDASKYWFGFRLKKTTGAVPARGARFAFEGGSPTAIHHVRLDSTTGQQLPFTGVPIIGTVYDRGDHWEYVGSAANNASGNVTCSLIVYPASAPFGAVADSVTATGTATFADVWAARKVVDNAVGKWQVGGLNGGASAFNALGVMYSARATWGGVERVRFNPEDAAIGAVTWLAPTGEAWTIAGGPSVQAGTTTFASTNPALILDDFMRTFARRTVNGASVKIARDYCDALMSTNDKRATLTITLAEARDVSEWIEVLRGYIPAWVVFKEGEWHIIPDAPSAPVLDYNADTDNRTDGDAPMSLVKRGVREVPNVIEVSYTDTSVKPWTDKKAVAVVPGLGTGRRRKSSIAMPGIRSLAQAYRYAVERLNHFTLESVEGEVAVMDNGIAVLPGDIVTITDSAHGWAAKPVRVLRVDERDNGRWLLRFREYFAGAYSTDAPVAPAPPSSGTLPNPLNVSAVTGLAAVEVLRFEQGTDTAGTAIARGLIWQSRIEASWTPSPDSFLDYYEVALLGATLTQPAVTTSKLPQFSSATLIQGATYQIQVRVVNSLGVVGPWSMVAVEVKGKLTPPSNVSIIDFAAEIGGEAIIRWRAVADLDVVRYEWRALATAAATAPWDSMALVDRPDTTSTRIKGLSPGPTLFAVKAIDSVGRYSVTPLYVSLTITSDASAFLQTFDFIFASGAGTATLRYDDPIIEGSTARPLPRFITRGNVMWDLAMPNPVASLAAPVVAGFGRNAAWNAPCNLWDFGLTLESTVKINLSWWRALRGTVTIYAAYSVDGVNFTYDKFWQHTAGQATLGWVTAAITARYLRLEAYSNAVTDTMMQEGAIQAQVSSSTRKESGTSTSLASGAKRVNLAAKYTRAVSITITPKGTGFASPSYDNVLVGLAVTPNSFDAYLFNASGGQIARDFAWTFEGV